MLIDPLGPGIPFATQHQFSTSTELDFTLGALVGMVSSPSEDLKPSDSPPIVFSKILNDDSQRSKILSDPVSHAKFGAFPYKNRL